MLKYTVKRLLQSLVTIFLIATAVFLMMRCLPTDYYFTEEQLMKFTDQQKTAALEAAGLTDPIPTQLVKFYNNLLHLDFGTSRRIQNGAPVVKVIGKKFGVSMRLGLSLNLTSYPTLASNESGIRFFEMIPDMQCNKSPSDEL